MGRYFGTDGIRGLANREPITTDMALKLGQAIAYFCCKDSKRKKIVVGKDTRISGDMLENAIVAGICSMGIEALTIGVFPTPGIAFLTQSMGADAGVVISASHNKFDDNGIKFFQQEGHKLSEAQEVEIEKLIVSDQLCQRQPIGEKVGRVLPLNDSEGRYILYAKKSFPENLSLEGFRIVLDCSNGAAYKVAPAVFSELGAEVITVGDEPNGLNINQQCGSQCPQLISSLVKKNSADIGIALDGDGDRVIFSDEEGRIVDGDAVLAFCGRDLIQSKQLPHNTVVATVMSNIGLELSLKQVGGRLVRTDVGDRHVTEEMRKSGFILGGEPSGHMIFQEYSTTGDGIITALQVLALMKRKGLKVSELSRQLTAMPQVLLNLAVKRKPPIEEVIKLNDHIRQVENELGEKGRLLIRYSGTEPLLRIMVEGPDPDLIKKYAEEISETARLELG